MWLHFKCLAPYRSNLPFLISDIRALCVHIPLTGTSVQSKSESCDSRVHNPAFGSVHGARAVQEEVHSGHNVLHVRSECRRNCDRCKELHNNRSENSGHWLTNSGRHSYWLVYSSSFNPLKDRDVNWLHFAIQV